MYHPSPTNTQPTNTSTETDVTSPNVHIHGFDGLAWDDTNEPPSNTASTTPTLYHLLSKTRLLVVGYYPETNDLSQPTHPDTHYIAWAPLCTNANFLLC